MKVPPPFPQLCCIESTHVPLSDNQQTRHPLPPLPDFRLVVKSGLEYHHDHILAYIDSIMVYRVCFYLVVVVLFVTGCTVTGV